MRRFPAPRRVGFGGVQQFFAESRRFGFREFNHGVFLFAFVGGAVI
jgi:hypothetical protein